MIRRMAATIVALVMLALAVVGAPAPPRDQASEWWRGIPGSVEACNLLGYTDATAVEVIDWLEARGQEQATAAVLTSLWHGCAW